ncbi:MAG: S1/P1 Nuclease, partial [Bacteroidetes bacterium]|nr:S1/P1 Nuclease [Bacteroidota bacterium]
MKIFKTIAIIFLFIVFSSLAFAWGVWGHKHINKSAVFALPESMRVFFYNHIDFVTQESPVPDIRKYTINDRAEGPRHYIDIEAFQVSIDSLPQSSKDASAKYPDSILRKNGFLPWYIQDMMGKLTIAFKEKKTSEILFLAADLGHYLGDAHMPLHTSLNHDGQFTHQNGIHSFWESQLPEQFGKSYNLFVADAKYIPDVTKETWRIIKHTHLLADTLLMIERKVKSTFPEDKIYMKNDKGGVLKNKYNSP